MKKVSVIIPSYNCANYVSGAVESILNQTYQNIEVMIIDDGSRDATRAVCDELVKKHPGRVQYVYQENQGVSVARNKGIVCTSGELVAFLDADDLFGPDFIEGAVRMIEAGEADFVIPARYCHRLVKPDGSVELEEIHRKWPENKDDFYAALCSNFIGSVGMLARRQCFDAVRFDWKLAGGEDYDVWLSLVEKDFKARMIESQTPQFFYTIRQGSAVNAGSAAGRKKYLSGLYRVLKKHDKYALQKDARTRPVLADKCWRIGMELVRNNPRDFLGYRALLDSQLLECSGQRMLEFIQSGFRKLQGGKA